MSKKTNNENLKRNTLSLLSNPFSTGGGGGDFERKVQATFILTLLIEGFSPLLNASVTSLDFQAKRLGWDTDDLLVTSLVDEQERKLLCQIKHGVAFTTSNTAFKKVVYAAWNDFNKPEFDKQHDKIALITGLSSKSDVLRFIYNQAKVSKDEKDFIQRIYERKYSSNDNREKLEVIRQILRDAKGEEVTECELWEFCKVFAVLVFDLSYKNNVNEFLIQALILSNSKANTAEAWEKLLDYAGQCNKTAAHVNIENMPDYIKELFEKEILKFATPTNLDSFSPDTLWAKLALLGGWDENNQFDKQLIEDFLGSNYSAIQSKVQENSISPSSIVTFDNGVWRIKNSAALIEKCSHFFFDDSIKLLFQLATFVFQSKDKRIQPDGTFSLLIPSNGAFDHSGILRNGLIHGIAILCNSSIPLLPCSDGLVDHEARLFVRNLLSNFDSSIWNSLDSTLTIIAEIHPAEFLARLEKTILSSPETIEALFPKNNSNIMFSRNSICSVLWSIECLAWDETYFITCIRILGELASLNYEKTNHANTPIRSIINIMLPWYPQTLATTRKQKNAIKSLQNDSPQIAWRIIKQLLPHSTTSTGGTNKPKYIIKNLPEEVLVSPEQIIEMQNYYSNVAIELAKQDIKKLHDLLNHFENMDKESVRAYLKTILDTSSNWDNETKYPVWSKMSIYRSWVVNNATEDLDKEMMDLLSSVIEKTTPDEAIYNFRLLFEPQYFDYDEDESDGTLSKLQKRRNAQQDAPDKIYNSYGIKSVIQFGRDVNNLSLIANYLGRSLDKKELRKLIKTCFDNDLEKEFFATVLYGFFYANDISDICDLGLDEYPPAYIAWVFTCFPIDNKIFKLVDQFLADHQNLYWETISIPHLGVGDEADANFMWNKLINYNRQISAINLFGIDTNNCSISTDKIEEALIAASSMNSEEALDPNAVRNLINYLQINAPQDINIISDIEVIYLPWLDEYSKVKPKALRYRLSNEPQFFCDLIALMYKKRHAKTHDEQLPENVSKRLFEIFFRYSIVPGTDWEGKYHEDIFNNWIAYCKKWGSEQDRIEVVQQTIGNGLSYAKRCENGLIDEFIIKELNKAGNEDMRRGFSMGIYNQRGASWVDPEGKPEYKLANEYNELASKSEELGYSRFAETLREIADSYTKEAEFNIKQHRKEMENED